MSLFTFTSFHIPTELQVLIMDSYNFLYLSPTPYYFATYLLTFIHTTTHYEFIHLASLFISAFLSSIEDCVVSDIKQSVTLLPHQGMGGGLVPNRKFVTRPATSLSFESVHVIDTHYYLLINEKT